MIKNCRNRLTLVGMGFWMLLQFGCASYGVIANAPLTLPGSDEPYSIETGINTKGSVEISFLLSFSGGGTRAAALSYGVLEALRDTMVEIDGKSVRMLDEIDIISSVSGGSFTSAYYGLHGDAIFDDFQDVFLKRDVQGGLIRRLLKPKHWFSSTGRTDLAVALYEETVFKGATFADLRRREGPLIVINASDLGRGVRFSFVQEYFSLLCSDISTFPVARAVTASSSVPFLFNPVVIKNHQPCDLKTPAWLEMVEGQEELNHEMSMIVEGLQSYFNSQRNYIHLVDGGITDNLGTRAIYEFVVTAGGAKAFLGRFKREPPRYFVIMTVDAATDPQFEMDKSLQPPSIDETISAVSNTQLYRYSAATEVLLNEAIKRWAKEMSTPARPVEPYFIQIRLKDIQPPDLAHFFNQIPTSFSLSDEQVDRLIEAGHDLLRGNPEFQRFLNDLAQND
jgi:NTE family protein